MGSASELTHERGNSLICCPEQDEIPWAALGKEGFLLCNDIERVQEEPVLSLTILQRATSN